MTIRCDYATGINSLGKKYLILILCTNVTSLKKSFFYSCYIFVLKYESLKKKLKLNELDKDYDDVTCFNSSLMRPFELPPDITEDTSVRYFTAPYMSSIHDK